VKNGILPEDAAGQARLESVRAAKLHHLDAVHDPFHDPLEPRIAGIAG
jgi:hypothetical protein